MQLTSTIEQDPEYQLIISANNLTVEIDNEISIIHKVLYKHSLIHLSNL
jgi:U4/U6 small nuclear ribonucleoprotein PRP31